MSIEVLRYRPATAWQWLLFAFWTNPFFFLMGLLFALGHVAIWARGDIWVSKFAALFLVCYAGLVYTNWRKARKALEATDDE